MSPDEYARIGVILAADGAVYVAKSLYVAGEVTAWLAAVVAGAATAHLVLP